MSQGENTRIHTADVVVVGSGSAGAVVARRLVDAGRQRPAARGGSRRTTTRRSTIPRASSSCGTANRTGATAPCRRRRCAGRELHWPRGRVLGGSSALNGMIYARGAPQPTTTAGPHARQPRAGSYDDVLPLFKRSEDFDRGAGRLPRRRRAAGGDARATSPTRSTPRPSPPRRRPASRSTTTTTATELDGVALLPARRSGTAVRHSVADGLPARPVLGSSAARRC